MTLVTYLDTRAAGYDVNREGLRARLVQRFPASGPHRFDVGAQEPTLAKAIVAVGAADAQAFEPLVGAVLRRIDELDRADRADADADADAVQPNLAVLSVANSLQLMGLELPERTVRTGASWLAGMQTTHDVPEWMHWNRGLAALALADSPLADSPLGDSLLGDSALGALATARTIAALPVTGPVPADLGVSPGWSIQAWFALLVAAVERPPPWEAMRPRWDELLLRFETFLETQVLSDVSLPWLARVVGHRIAGIPLPGVADWLHHELHRVAAG